MAQVPVITNGNLDFQACAVGDSYENSAEEHVFIENSSGSTAIVRLKAQNSPRDPAIPAVDRDISCPDGLIQMLDPAVHPKWYNTGGGTVQVEYPNGITGLRICVLRIRAARIYE